MYIAASDQQGIHKLEETADGTVAAVHHGEITAMWQNLQMCFYTSTNIALKVTLLWYALRQFFSVLLPLTLEQKQP